MRKSNKNGLINPLHVILTGVILVFCSSLVKAEDELKKIIGLEGQWKYSIGEQDNWIKPGYNDDDWESIKVPSPWEDQGFHGYNGYGTYRKTFQLSSSLKDKNLYLVMGYVDDVDETYVNGIKVGSTGSFPPHYQSAYNAKRIYPIPSEILNYDGKNVITVIVYDSYQYGGIVSGEIGIYANPLEIPLQINLQGTWKFEIGDNLDWSAAKYNDTDWHEIFVPGKWEDQGYRDYDGYAWYRKTFFYRGTLKDEKAVLILGKIDDVDEVYVNGVKVGATGEFTTELNQRIPTGDRYRARRGYLFDTNILKSGQWNTIAIRVYDSGGAGGVYEGPIGILTQEGYIDYWRDRKNNFR